ncbi:MAG: gliding motility-associated C-terminal domain-containing protein [Bacteroidia bacterium]
MFAKIIMKNSLLFVLFFCCALSASATHNRAGEITYRQISLLNYEATIVTYTKHSSNIDRPTLIIFWGDEPPGSQGDTIPRISQTNLPNDIDINVYQKTHNYPAAGNYLLHCEDMNRNGGIINIPNSVNTSFYIQSLLQINPFLGPNNSPILLNPPIDQGCANQLFVHNPGAFDPDGDSLSYELFTCRGNLGTLCPGYFFPTATSFFRLDSINGDLIWNTPDNFSCGEWNVAFLIKEWRNGVNIGYVERDMQITIYCSCPNNPPVLTVVNDTCVEAGTFISFDVSATDPDTTNDKVNITASGGPFLVQPDSAYLSPQPSTSPYIRTFSWQTQCNHVRKSAYSVLFKAEDDHPNPAPPPTNFNLAVFKTVNITVVSPSPKNPVAIPFGNTIHLSWNACVCTEAIGYDIYRRNGFYGFIPGYCELGVPAYTGYSKIASVTGLNTTTYTDDNNGAGLINGIDYCYMIVARFDDGAESYASVEVCSQLKRDLPVITNVSINATDATNGSVYIAWSKPTELDTVQTPGPFEYILYRSNDFTGSSFALVDSFFDLNDTIYVDSLLNTVNSPWSYKIEFYNLTPGNSFKIGQSQIASSVFLSIAPTDHSNVLSWHEKVPWLNASYTVYRQNISGVFDSIANTNLQTYTDTGLVNGTEYCYLIRSNGNYSADGFVNPIVNFSQEKCATPIDNVPPCAPDLTVTPDCPHFRNILKWKFNNAGCPDDVGMYNIYFAADSVNDMLLIGTVYNGADSIFIDDSLASIAGCYTITAVDTNGNESAFSEKICVDNCPIYVLPNVFTPNGDGKNDTFHPLPYSYVESVDIQIFDRWGLVMFKTTNPDVNWDGTFDNKGKECPDGVYYYVCTVNEIYISGIRPRIIKGFVHLLRNK